MRMLFIIAIALFLFASCSSDTMGGGSHIAYDKNKAFLAGEEKGKPLSFLKVYASDKKNMFGSTVVKGAVANSATVCSYKDVRIKLMGFDKSGKVAEEHEDVLSGAIKPNSSMDFKLRYHLPKNADSISLSIMSATVAE